VFTESMTTGIQPRLQAGSIIFWICTAWST